MTRLNDIAITGFTTVYSEQGVFAALAVSRGEDDPGLPETLQDGDIVTLFRHNSLDTDKRPMVVHGAYYQKDSPQNAFLIDLRSNMHLNRALLGQLFADGFPIHVLRCG